MSKKTFSSFAAIATLVLGLAGHAEAQWFGTPETAPPSAPAQTATPSTATVRPATPAPVAVPALARAVAPLASAPAASAVATRARAPGSAASKPTGSASKVARSPQVSASSVEYLLKVSSFLRSAAASAPTTNR